MPKSEGKKFDARTLVIAKRDYLSRVRTPGFWIGTVILPLLMGAWIVLPSLIMSKSRGGLRLTVVDETGKVASRLEKEIAGDGQADGGPQVDFTLRVDAPAADRAAQKKELDRRVLADEIDAWLWVDPQVFADNKVEYHGRTLSNVITLGRVERVLSRVVREQRLAAAGYDPEQIADLVEGVDLEKIRVTEEGGKADAGVGDLILAIGLFTILYMAIMIYGQMVMHGVLEEKTNRVVEVIASTIDADELMAGKLLGICAVALTQIGIWLGSAAVLTAPAVIAGLAMPPGFNMPTLSAGGGRPTSSPSSCSASSSTPRSTRSSARRSTTRRRRSSWRASASFSSSCRGWSSCRCSTTPTRRWR